MKPKFKTRRMKTDDPLVVFLYLLLRDHLPFGEVEGIMMGHIENDKLGEGFLSEPTIGRYAKQLAERLRKEK